jgi:HSP20 family molecular chaperone IbpA
MKPILKNSIISLISAFAGGALVFGATKYDPSFQGKAESKEKPSRETIYDDILNRQKAIQQEFDDFFDDQFFNQQDPFEEMKKMRSQMEERMRDSGPGNRAKGNPFDFWFTDKFGGGSIDDISRREDGEFVYYDIKVDDVNATSLSTKIENGYITITGTLEKRSAANDGSDESVFKSTFNRTFPLPEHIDQKNMQVSPEKDKIVLKFPKLKA